MRLLPCQRSHLRPGAVELLHRIGRLIAFGFEVDLSSLPAPQIVAGHLRAAVRTVVGPHFGLAPRAIPPLQVVAVKAVPASTAERSVPEAVATRAMVLALVDSQLGQYPRALVVE